MAKFGFSQGFIYPRKIASSNLLHFEGVQGGSSGIGTDASANGYNYTNNGATYDLTQPQPPPFGTSYGLFYPAAYLQSSVGGSGPTSAFNWGTGDFTVDFWCIFGNAERWGFQQGILDCGNGGSGAQAYLNTSTGNIRWRASGANLINSNQSLTFNARYHFAFTRAAGTLRGFLNGTLYATVADTTTYTTSASHPYIGRDQAGLDPFQGWLKEFHVVQGSALWTASFTPPTSAYTS